MKRAPNKSNPYYKLLDWDMPDFNLHVSVDRESGEQSPDEKERYVKQAVLIHHGIDMSADSCIPFSVDFVKNTCRTCMH